MSVDQSTPARALGHNGELTADALAQRLAGLGASGKLLGLGALVGILAAFLPAYSDTLAVAKEDAGVVIFQSWMVLSDWRGLLCFLGYLGTIALVWGMYVTPVETGKPSSILYTTLGVAAVVLVCSVLLLAVVLRGAGGVPGVVNVSVGLGTFLNCVAAISLAGGAALRAHEEKVF